MNHFQKQYQGKSKGFSFGETILAAFILSVGLLVVVQVFRVSIANSLFLRDATIASELAQEGVELVRNVRDNNFIAGGNGFATFSSSSRHCYIAVNSPTLNCVSSSPNIPGTTRYNMTYSGGQYISTSSTSKFRRYLYIQYTAVPTQANIKSFVVWDPIMSLPSTGITTNCSIQTKCVYTEVTLTNWKS